MGLEGLQTGMELVGTMRQPYETSDIVDFSGGGTRRLRPPASLGQRERAVFIDLVTSCDPRHFRNSDVPLMCRYVEAVVLAEQASGELAATGVVVEGKVSPWFQVLGLAAIAVLVVFFHFVSFFLILIALLGISSARAAFRNAKNPYYTSVPANARVALGAAWLGLVLYLGVMSLQAEGLFASLAR